MTSRYRVVTGFFFSHCLLKDGRVRQVLQGALWMLPGPALLMWLSNFKPWFRATWIAQCRVSLLALVATSLLPLES